MRWPRFAILILFVTVLQASLLARLNIKPDLLLILLVFFSVYSNRYQAIITSFTIGFAADIIGPTMGPHMISFGLFGTLLAQLNRVVSIRTMPYQAAVIFVTGLLAALSTQLLTLLKTPPTAPNIYAVVLGTSLYSAVVGPFLFLPLTWWMGIRTHRLRQY